MGRSFRRQQIETPREAACRDSFEPEVELTFDPDQDRIKAAFVTSLVAMVTRVPALDIVARGRNTPAARARQLAMYLTHTGFGWPLARVAQAFGRDPSTACYACHRIEDQREDKIFDSYLLALETCLRAAPEGEPA